LIHRMASLALLVLTLMACNGDGSGTTPTPAASATPTPVPASSPSPAASSCSLPPSTNPQNDCSVRKPRFSDQVNGAIDRVMAQRPELFDFSDTSGGVPRVVNPAGYYSEVKKALEAQGICTRIDEEEIAIKQTNDWSEDWKILTSLSFVRRHCAGTCTPAWW
jgi:hypothetical protein